jgi:3,4-dihydroxy 2-butanone 4-phosphate synthase/GTP cyclohydrolase II
MSVDPLDSSIALDPFEDVLAEFRVGRPVVVIDDAERENEGDVVIATDAITPEVVAFLMREARGLICVSISREVAERIQLPFQAVSNNSPFQTPFTVSVDAREVGAFGVTAAGRVATMKKLLEPTATSEDFLSSGHVFPLVAHDAGVIARQGHTEGSFDLARICGFSHSGVLCEILNPDGSMCRGAALQSFASKHRLKITSIGSIQEYRALNEISVRALGVKDVETSHGFFKAHIFADDVEGKEHIALVRGDLKGMPSSYAPLVRVHSECLTGDVFGSRRCDCGLQLDGALKVIADEGAGIILYLRQEGRGIGLENKIKAYQLQEQGLDTVEANLQLGFEADERSFAVAAHMLLSLGVQSIRLITNNPRKSKELEAWGVAVAARVPTVVSDDPCSARYLQTKREKLGHLLP